MITSNFQGSPNIYYGLVQNNARWFYAHCLDGGYNFNVVEGKLQVSPAHHIDNEMTELILTHKTELIEIVTNHLKERVRLNSN